jgi:hypothetical protein
MPTPTYTPLANVTLGTATASVTFSSIPATYRDLILVINTTGNTGAGFYFQFNGDTGSNYSYVYALGESAGASSAVVTATEGRMGNIETGLGVHILNIMDYSATDKHKTVLVRSDNAPANRTWMFANRWASTSAITSVRIFPFGATMSSGATLSLYGIVS